MSSHRRGDRQWASTKAFSFAYIRTVNKLLKSTILSKVRLSNENMHQTLALFLFFSFHLFIIMYFSPYMSGKHSRTMGWLFCLRVWREGSVRLALSPSHSPPRGQSWAVVRAAERLMNPCWSHVRGKTEAEEEVWLALERQRRRSDFQQGTRNTQTKKRKTNKQNKTNKTTIIRTSARFS